MKMDIVITTLMMVMMMKLRALHPCSRCSRCDMRAGHDMRIHFRRSTIYFVM